MQNRTVSKAIAKVKKQDPRARRIAEMLYDYVLERYPYYKSQCKVDKWIPDIEKLNRIDGASYEGIEAILRYMFEIYQPNSDFDWREQIRSGNKFRKHFYRLYELAKKDYDRSKIDTI